MIELEYWQFILLWGAGCTALAIVLTLLLDEEE